MTDFKDKLGGLADKLKKETPKTPIKTYGVEYDTSLKDISIDALKFFLDTKLKKSK
jgi:hypothetical protein